MDNEELIRHWDSISTVLRRAIRQASKLPEREQDPEFSEWLESALDHSDRRADALIDPS